VIRGADLDHVALAAESQAELWPRYAGDLSGSWGGGGFSPGFNWAYVVFANGMRVEALEPARVEQNDFLRRFLDHSGPGPHHLTYKVPSLRSALDEVVTHGYRPVSVDESNPAWKEAFIHPKDGPGVVVQLAESAEDDGSSHYVRPPRPVEWPAATSASFDLDYVAHAVADMTEGRRFFIGLLGGEVVGEGSCFDHQWVDIRWPGPGRVRLLNPIGSGPVADWLGRRNGRMDHLALTGPHPERIPDAVADPEERWIVEPQDNLGTRLVLGSS
jgi:catechol 2,3-dioxygenase-like lactoylglutathione lyase family enzyme